MPLSSSLLPSPVSLSPAPSPAPAAPQAPELRAFGDHAATRRRIYDDVLQAARNLEPLQNARHTLTLEDVDYADPEQQSKKAHKEALLGGNTLSRRLRGTWVLRDNASGKVLDQKTSTVARVPHLTDAGTFVVNGVDYTLAHQQRLLPGIYTRQKANGELEAHVNPKTGTGPAHRLFLDPAKSVFHLKLGQAQLPLLPLLRAMGATDAQLREAWGAEMLAANANKSEHGAMAKLQSKLLSASERADPDDANRQKALLARLAKMEFDPTVTQRTLGTGHRNTSLASLLDTTKKLLAVSRGEAKTDDRDQAAFQRFLGPEDLFAERLARDHGRLRHNLFFKASLKGHLRDLPASALTSQLEQALLGSGLGNALEEVNPLEVFGKNAAITRMGEGGLASSEAIPAETKTVAPSHLGFMDPVLTPESERAGVDLYLARGARKGRDGKLYAPFRNRKTGQIEYKAPAELADAAVAFPGSQRSSAKRVPVIRGGELAYANQSDVAWELPAFEDTFSPQSNLVPLKSADKGQRVSMGGRMLTQALPLVSAEAPLVQSGLPGAGGARSFEEEYGAHLGAVRARGPGRVVNVTPDAVTVKYADGKTETHELDHFRPMNRKTFFTQTPQVQAGDQVTANHLLASSNFTDKQGTAALGLNARVAYLPWKGLNWEDALVVSESMAKRLTSQHAYQHELLTDAQHKLGKKNFISLFPGKYDKETLANFNDDGLIKPGTRVEHGQPLILAARQRDTTANKIHKKGQAGYDDQSVTWEHHDPGVVTDVVQGRHGPVVVVHSESETRQGDKLSNRYGGKGVISAIIPDAQMPQDAEGRPFEVLLQPTGLLSRTNATQILETALGKIAAKTGKSYKLPDFEDIDDLAEFVQQELGRHGMKSLEDVVDPGSGNKIPGVFTGNQFMMKLLHSAEAKAQGRSGGSYSADESPSKGGPQGSKRISVLDVNALLAGGNTETLRDAGAVRGQKNDNLWLQFMSGHNPSAVKVPMAYEKFVNQLQASGINVVRQGHRTHVMAMTDKDVDALAGDRAISSGETVHFDKGLKPVPGGLFDVTKTGGHGARQWSYYPLAEPLPNPVMEEPLRRILGLTQKQLHNVIAGKEDLPNFGGTGPEAIQKALDGLSLPRELARARMEMKGSNKGKRDAAIRRLGFLRSAADAGLHPRDWMLSKVPVLPPAFRPISVLGQTGVPLVADANYLYKELIDADKNLQAMKQEVGHANVGAERAALYHSLKAVTGLAEPQHPKLQEKGVRGILAEVFGTTPKFGSVQRKLISSTVDNVGRSTIVPNPDLDMDTAGIPENQAFEVYKRFIVRRLHRRGMSLTRSLDEVEKKSPLARSMLQEEMDQRPVVINRAPVLHKFGILAFRPKLVKGDVVQMPPLVFKGLGMDADGDAVQWHVPATDEASREAYAQMLPSTMLLSPADFKTPVHVPTQETAGGLYTASTAMSQRRPRVFRNRADALAAYRRGDLRFDDPIQLLQH